MGGIWTQLFPPSPTFTESSIPPQTGKTIIVTGGNAGVGFEIANILYSKGATVYIAARSQQRIDEAISAIIQVPASIPGGRLKSLVVDFADLTTISPAVATFLAQEERLDVLFNNAGVSGQPPGSTSAQGYEVHMAINCLGPYLFTKLLLPTLISTARTLKHGSARIVWASSGIVDTSAPPGGLVLAEQAPGKHSRDKYYNYAASKAGDWFLASEVDRRVRQYGIVSVAVNPGTLRTKGWDSVGWFPKLLMGLVMHEPVRGAYTMLWAGLSDEIGVEDGGRYGIPWGRWHPDPKRDILHSLKTVEDGGTGLAGKFWEWCDGETKGFVGDGVLLGLPTNIPM